MFTGFFTRSTPAPVEAAPVTYTDPTAWMTDAERAYHVGGAR